MGGEPRGFVLNLDISGYYSVIASSPRDLSGPWNGTPKYDLHRVAEACHQAVDVRQKTDVV